MLQVEKVTKSNEKLARLLERQLWAHSIQLYLVPLEALGENTECNL